MKRSLQKFPEAMERRARRYERRAFEIGHPKSLKDDLYESARALRRAAQIMRTRARTR